MLFYEDLSDVVLVGHSYGGMVITGVAANLRHPINAFKLITSWVAPVPCCFLLLLGRVS
jgi:alpha-beta hydrolase superfamily lysophospholipase